MTAGNAQSAEKIQELLDERLKVMQWIDKLNAATGDIPDDVRDRVKADYQTRLDGVAAELQNYTTELQNRLLEQQHERDRLSGVEKNSEARLAEAKLRHAVGEFGDQQWNQLNAEISGELTSVRGQLEAADQEIGKLEEVLSLIRQKPPSTQVRKAIPMVEPPPPPPPAAAPAPAPAPAPQPLVSQPQSDEMAFINSVSGSKPATGEVAVTHDTPEPNAPPPPPPPPATPPPVAAPVPEAEAPNAEAAGSGPQKTLKCGECGVMNFPTEWYCERCGAELAAL